MLDLDGISGLSDDDPLGAAFTTSKNKKPNAKKKIEEDDGWGNLEGGLDDKPAPKISGGSKFGFGGPTGLRKEKVEEDEWGLDTGPTKGGRLLGRKSIGKEADDLDNMLDEIEDKRGMESTKIQEEPTVTQKRVKTAHVRSSGFGGFGDDGLDDLDDGL
jgi:hypothetical protein